MNFKVFPIQNFIHRDVLEAIFDLNNNRFDFINSIQKSTNFSKKSILLVV